MSSADIHTFWSKNFEFFEIYVVSVRTSEGGVGGQFCAGVFYGRPLITIFSYLQVGQDSKTLELILRLRFLKQRKNLSIRTNFFVSKKKLQVVVYCGVTETCWKLIS